MATNKTEVDKPAVPATRGLKVIAKRDGFRRAGREWVGTTTVPLSELTKEQADALKAETLMLVVEEVDIKPAKA
jgi:hypothetical protein